MSDLIVGKVNDTKASDGQFMRSYQSVWISHWKRTSCNSTTQAHNGCSNTVMELDYTMGEDNSANKSKVSRSVKRHEEIVTKAFEIMNESPRMNLESLIKEGLEFQDLSMVHHANCGSGFLFNLGQDTDGMQASRCVSGYDFDRVESDGCETEIQFPEILASNEIFRKTCNYRDEGTSKNPPEWTQTHSSAKDRTAAASKPLWECFVKSSSDTGPLIFERENPDFGKEKTSVPPFIGRSAIVSSNQLLDANLRLREHEYHHNHDHLVDLVCEGKIDGHSRPRNSLTACFRQSNTSSLFDPPSMASHHLSALSREWFQKMQKYSGFRLFPNQFNTSEKNEVKKSLYDRYLLQKVPKCAHNVETMRLCTAVDSVLDPGGGCPRFCQATHHLLITNSTPSKKVPNHLLSYQAVNMDCNFPPQTSVASPKQAGQKRPNTELLDINLNLPALPATVTSSENGDLFSSRSQSLEMDRPLTHTDQPKQQSSLCLDSSPAANPGNRWVKRLKLTSSDSVVQVKKRSSTAEPSAQEQLNNLFGRIHRSAIISSEQNLMKPHGQDEYFYKELLPSHAWIQRWLHNGSSSTKNKSGTVKTCEPRSKIVTLEELQNKQFPSIAAMALMGKAMSGSQPCELQKMGSLTVWNSRALGKLC